MSRKAIQNNLHLKLHLFLFLKLFFLYQIHQFLSFASFFRANLQYQIMQMFLPQGRNQEPKQPEINKQNTQPVAQQREEVPMQYFIPPPINYMNSKYYQHFLDNQNPLRNLTDLTATYKVFREELPFNTNENSKLFQFQSLQSLKNRLVCSNRQVYMQMLKILARQARGSIMNEQQINNLNAELERKVWAYKELCMKLKVFETRNQILKRMSNETFEINQKTAEIRTELQQIKSEFRKVSTEIKIIEQFGPQQSAMQIQH